jgi:hypothetical protein
MGRWVYVWVGWCGWVWVWVSLKRLVCCHSARSVRLLNQQTMRSREGNTRIAPDVARCMLTHSTKPLLHHALVRAHINPLPPPSLYALASRSHVNCIRFVLRDDVDASMASGWSTDPSVVQIKTTRRAKRLGQWDGMHLARQLKRHIHPQRPPRRPVGGHPPPADGLRGSPLPGTEHLAKRARTTTTTKAATPSGVAEYYVAAAPVTDSAYSFQF